jgi:hypothetical protein
MISRQKGQLLKRMFLCAGTPSPFSITNRAVEIAHAIDLPCPQINTEKWLDRFVRELELPHVSSKLIYCSAMAFCPAMLQ